MLNIKSNNRSLIKKPSPRSACVALRDPYCGWAPSKGACVAIGTEGALGGALQNVTGGRHAECGEEAWSMLYLFVSNADNF